MERGRIQGLPNFFKVPPIISGTDKATNFKIWQVYSQGPSEEKPFNILGENGAWVNPGTPQIFEVLPIISGRGKAMNVKFGKYIQRVHANKSRLKIWEKMAHGRIQGPHKFFKYPLLSQERIKLRTSNLAVIFTGSIRTKSL